MVGFNVRRALARAVPCRCIGIAAAAIFVSPTVTQAAAVELFKETFDNIDFTGVVSSDPRRFGVPTTTGQSDSNTATIGTADRDWYAARIERHDDGNPYQDVGVQKFGGSTNATPVGIAEDDAGLLARISTLGYTGITLSFDWRTFSANSGDELVVGYFVGDLLGTVPGSLQSTSTRSLDLRTTADGGMDGGWNWTAGWTELLRDGPSDSFTHEMFNLTGADNQANVWLAFWLDNGEGDFAKIDNIIVTGLVVPLPAPLVLLISGLAGIALLRRRPVL